MMGNFEQNPTAKRKVIVDNEGKLESLVNHLTRLDAFAFDTETNTTKVLGENSNLIAVGISFSWATRTTIVLFNENDGIIGAWHTV